ncbi:TetR family transcriptional regulator C-terminal domain-containing protein [Lyngbya aestuarii]|uniref:TetR family transcriptional regulator C-terminal domain-containing protein n=1 Tax=Lyngbya aestuarii TaxID=118322 RepID=UPI00403DEEA8
MNRSDTKTALLKAGTCIIREKGYNHTGIKEILQSTGVPKGSFYHYFNSKEDFGLQIIENEAIAHDQFLEQYLGNEALTPLTRLRHYFEAKCEEFGSLQCREGCLLGNLGQELADQNEIFRSRLQKIFARWRQRFAECLKQAQEAGEISSSFDVPELAEYCLNAWEGAILQMKITKSIAPLTAFMNITFGYVLKG